MNSHAPSYFSSPSTLATKEESIKQPFSNRKKIPHQQSRKQSFKNNSDSEIEDYPISDDIKQPLSFQNCVLYVSHLPISFNRSKSSDFHCTLLTYFPVIFSISSPVSERYYESKSCMSNDKSKALILFADASQAAKALVMNGTVFRGETIHVRFSTTMYVDPVNYNTCPSIRDLTEDYYGKIAHRFNSSEYAQIPWHMPSNKVHLVGFDGSNPNIKEILMHMFSTYGKVVNITVIKNMAWIEMDSVESATNSIAIIHNSHLYTLPGKLLRVSYATYGNK